MERVQVDLLFGIVTVVFDKFLKRNKVEMMEEAQKTLAREILREKGKYK